MDNQELIEHLKVDGYTNLRQLADGCIVGTIDLMYTRGVCIGLNEWSWERRYCYQDRGMATVACNALMSEDDEPLAGYVAMRSK